MSQIQGNKLYAICVVATRQFSWLNFRFSYEEEMGEPAPSVSAGSEAVYVSSTTLGGLTLAQFSAQKMPVFVSEEFDSWADKAAAPTVEIDVNPKDDGSNTPTVSISGGPASADFDYSFSRSDVSCNLQAGTGSFDEDGDASFGVKVYGQGDFTLTISPRGNNGFQNGTLNVTVEPFA